MSTPAREVAADLSPFCGSEQLSVHQAQQLRFFDRHKTVFKRDLITVWPAHCILTTAEKTSKGGENFWDVGQGNGLISFGGGPRSLAVSSVKNGEGSRSNKPPIYRNYGGVLWLSLGSWSCIMVQPNAFRLRCKSL